MISPKMSERIDSMVKEVEELGKDTWNTLQKASRILVFRCDDETKEKLNLLMESEAFKNRADVVKFLISKGIEADRGAFEEIDAVSDKISELEGKLQEIANGI